MWMVHSSSLPHLIGHVKPLLAVTVTFVLISQVRLCTEKRWNDPQINNALVQEASRHFTLFSVQHNIFSPCWVTEEGCQTFYLFDQQKAILVHL